MENNNKLDCMYDDGKVRITIERIYKDDKTLEELFREYVKNSIKLTRANGL